MKMISNREYTYSVAYRLGFHIKGHEGRGYTFDCDKDGNVNIPKMNNDARRNLGYCLVGMNERGERVIADGVLESEHCHTEPAIGECEVCGRKVVLSDFTNTCECGTDYNSAGQTLAPRSQWGEETGETAGDILMAEAAGFPDDDY